MPSWKNWSGRQRSKPAQLHFIRSETDAAAVVRAAVAGKQSGRVAGAGHSHAPLVLSDGVIVDASGLAGVVSTDAAHYALGDPITVTVEARYLFGQPAANLPVSLSALGYDEWGYDWETGVALRRWIDLQIGSHTGTTDVNGRWVTHVKAPYRSASDDYWYYYGWYDVDAMRLLVSRGTGTWGPPMRTGNTPEIVEIKLN